MNGQLNIEGPLYDVTATLTRWGGVPLPLTTVILKPR